MSSADAFSRHEPPPAVLAARYGHTDAWRQQEYQEEAAALFRSLGLEATTNERLDDVRGAHEVDVVVRSRRAGLEQFWVVECKWRRRRGEKLHVTALAEIVRDVGADRGVLLSEVGFQAGAVRMAYKSSVTLTSLVELREEAAEELLTLRLGECRLRLAHLHERLGAVGRVQHRGRTAMSVSYRASPGGWDPVKLYATVAIAEEGLRRAEMGPWPAPYAWDFASDDQHRARDLKSFIEGLTAALGELEVELAGLRGGERLVRQHTAASDVGGCLDVRRPGGGLVHEQAGGHDTASGTKWSRTARSNALASCVGRSRSRRVVEHRSPSVARNSRSSA